MKLHWPVLWVVAAIFSFASCQDVKRDFSPSSGGSGATGGRAPGTGGSDDAGQGSGAESAGGNGPAAGSGNVSEGGAGGGEGSACEPDAVRCRGDIPQVCGSDGTWEATHTTCAFGCVRGACSDCAEDTKGCESGQAKACIEGKWQYNPCEVVCEAGECVDSCTEEARQCEGLSKVQVCAGGEFVDDEECSGICRDGDCVGDCKPDAVRCQPGSTSVPEVCSADGEWTAGACTDATPVCLDGRCVACDPDATRCSESGVPQRCTEFGSWEDQAPCGEEAPACVEGQCALCAPSARRCNQGTPQQCNDAGTEWVDGAACTGATPACVAATGQCGTCRAGDRQCGTETTPQSCDSSGRWNDEPSCAGSTPNCLGGACVECKPKSRRCSGTTPELCNDNGKWVAQVACSGATPRCVKETGLCGCEENAVNCADANTPTACSAAGSWVTQPDCTGDTPLCQSGKCRCVEGTEVCTSGTTPRHCIKGEWQSMTCSGSTPVCVAGRCAECAPGTSRCGGEGNRTAERCTDGAWRAVEECLFCSKGQCYNTPSDPDLVACDARNGLICGKGNGCCLGEGLTEKSQCQDLTSGKCSSGFVPIRCDGPGHCDSRNPVCCATSAGVGCAATLLACSDARGQVVCDPSAAIPCPVKTNSCVRASETFFTCQAGRTLP